VPDSHRDSQSIGFLVSLTQSSLRTEAEQSDGGELTRIFRSGASTPSALTSLFAGHRAGLLQRARGDLLKPPPRSFDCQEAEIMAGVLSRRR
jgi:hypothetical protein